MKTWGNIAPDNITKTYLYSFDPLKPHYYIVKLGFTGVYIIFHISAQNIVCGYSLEPPRRGGSNEYPQSMFWAEIWKISDFFYLKISFFLVMKFSVYLNRRVFVMSFFFFFLFFFFQTKRTNIFLISLWKHMKSENRWFYPPHFFPPPLMSLEFMTRNFVVNFFSDQWNFDLKMLPVIKRLTCELGTKIVDC